MVACLDKYQDSSEPYQLIGSVPVVNVDNFRLNDVQKSTAAPPPIKVNRTCNQVGNLEQRFSFRSAM
jgi:hypothetical protein